MRTIEITQQIATAQFNEDQGKYKEARELNIKTNGEAISLEIEVFTTQKHYSVKVAIFDKDENDVTHDYYDIDYIKNKKEILDYFLN